jgi:hypothetical protein
VFDFVFVILSIAGLLVLLANAALHEDGGKHAVRTRRDEPHPSE